MFYVFFYFSQFQGIKVAAELPVKAVKAYQDIVDAIMEAKAAAEAAEKAADTAYHNVSYTLPIT